MLWKCDAVLSVAKPSRPTTQLFCPGARLPQQATWKAVFWALLCMSVYLVAAAVALGVDIPESF